MLRRPLHLLTLGLLAVATTAIDFAFADDPKPRLRREASSPTPSSSEPSRPQPTSRPQPQPANRAPAAAPRSAPNTSGLGANSIRNSLQQRAQQQQPPSSPMPRSAPRTETRPALPQVNQGGNRAPNREPALRNQQPTVPPTTRSLPQPQTAPPRATENRGRGSAPSAAPRLGQPGTTPNLDALRQRTEGRTPERRPDTGTAEQLRERMRDSNLGGRGDTSRSPTGGTRPATPSPEGLRERIETRKPELPNPGASEADRLRDRLRGSSEQRGNPPTGNADPGRRLPGEGQRPTTPNPEGLRDRMDNRNPAGANPAASEADRLRDRLRGSTERRGDNADTNRRGPLDGTRPGSPNLEGQRDRIETRKPDLSNPAASEADRLRDRLRGSTERRGDMPADNADTNRRGPEGTRVDLDRQSGRRSDLRIERNSFDRNRVGRQELAEGLRDMPRIRDVDDLRQRMDRFQDNPEVRNVLQSTNLRINDFSGAFQTRIRIDNSFNNIVQTDIGRRYNLGRQYSLAGRGDIGRQLNLNQTLIRNGGWNNRFIGPVYSQYTSAHFSAWYAGPSWYPTYAWTPRWSPWVSWSFWDYCLPIYDPRPFICRPIYYYHPAPPIVYYDYPVWQPLPVVSSGTWIDVPLSVAPSGYDLQLLAVRFVDPGHPEENLGPRYRVWLRNNSAAPVESPFNVMLVAGNDDSLQAGLPEAGVTVDAMEPEGVVPVDIRLPMDANRLNRGSNGQRIPFTTLHVLVDSHRELAELDETNNGLVISRGDILPVDPAAFSTDEPATFPGSMVSLAGEGFGPEPGELIVTVGNRQMPAEIHGWYDLGVYFKMPNLPLTGSTKADILVIRGDGAASNPVTVDVTGGN